MNPDPGDDSSASVNATAWADRGNTLSGATSGLVDDVDVVARPER